MFTVTAIFGILLGLTLAVGHRQFGARAYESHRRLGYSGSPEMVSRWLLWGGILVSLVGSIVLIDHAAF